MPSNTLDRVADKSYCASNKFSTVMSGILELSSDQPSAINGEISSASVNVIPMLESADAVKQMSDSSEVMKFESDMLPLACGVAATECAESEGTDSVLNPNLAQLPTRDTTDIPEGEICAKMQDSDVPEVNSNEKNDTDKEDFASILLCRLCAAPCQDLDPVLLFQRPPHNPKVLPKKTVNSSEEAAGDIFSLIKETLPIKVSCCDQLPKQVCRLCVERLRLSHAFTTSVLKAETHLISLRDSHQSGKVNGEINHNSFLPYDCNACKEIPLLLAKQIETHPFVPGMHWEKIIIKDEPQDPMEPTHEELERSYHDFFGGQKDFETFKTEERVTLRPSKPACLGGRRPRGRPRSRPLKVTPRGRRGRRSVNTTVEKILELSEGLHDDDYGFRIRSRENNPTSEALTQCLLCDRWLPGMAACLQHSLSQHMDCGAFLCPRCPRDDFPGDFELIQHYQETHCLDLELYEVLQVEKNTFCSPNNPQLEAEPQIQQTLSEQCSVKMEEQNRETEPMDYEILNNTLPSELYESQDEVSSNLSEIAPRSLTSHSALYEEESNSLSTHGSDSNLASEDVLSGQLPDTVLCDKIMVKNSGLRDTPCVLEVGDFTNAMEEDCQDIDKESNKPNFHTSEIDISSVNAEDHRSDYKSLQEESQESQDSLKTDDLCGFQQAINEKSEEVNLNGSSIQFDSDMT